MGDPRQPFTRGQVLVDPWFAGQGYFVVVDVDAEHLVVAELPHVLGVAIPVPEPEPEASPAPEPEASPAPAAEG